MTGRTWYLAALVLTALIGGLSFTKPGLAQAGHNYYTAASDRAAATDLRNVNRYHYGPAGEKLRKKQYQSAKGELEFVLRYFPNHPQALAMMVEVAIAAKRPDFAEGHLITAIERYPQYHESYVIYGTFLHRLGRTDQAIEKYNKALEINPDSPFGHYNLGLAYVDKKDYARANIHAQKAYQLGVTLPGLRKKLEAQKAWKAPPETATPAPDTRTPQPIEKQKSN